MYFKCVVCINTFGIDDIICSLQCGHVFHQHCLRQLNVFSVPKCPLCRGDSIIGVRRLHFARTPDAPRTVDLRHEVRQKSEMIQYLKKEMATMKLDYDKKINALQTKLQKVENTNSALRRELKIVKEENNKTQKDNKKLSFANSILLKNMEENLESKKLKQIDNTLQCQSAPSAKAKLMDRTPQMKRKTATSRRVLPLLSSDPSSTTSSANLNSHEFSMVPRLRRRNIAANVVKETPSSSGEKSTQKASNKRRATSSSQALCRATVDKQTAKRTRGRMMKR